MSEYANLGFQAGSFLLPDLRMPVASTETDGSQPARGNFGNDRPLTLFEIEQTVHEIASATLMSRAIELAISWSWSVEDEPLTNLSVAVVEAARCEAIGAFNVDGAVRVLEAPSIFVFRDLQMPGSIWKAWRRTKLQPSRPSANRGFLLSWDDDRPGRLVPALGCLAEGTAVGKCMVRLAR
jgi:hypothetical protein